MKVGANLRSALVTLRAILLHCLADHTLEFCGQGWIEASRCGRLLVQHRIQCCDHVVARERLFASRHLIEHHPKGEDIRARVQFFAARLLGRHVNGRAWNHAYRRERILDWSFLARSQPVVTNEFRQSEVQHFRMAALSDKDVRRLDVAMDDALSVGSGQRVRHLDRNFQQLIHLHRLAMDTRLQALALQLLHHDEGMPVVILNFVDGADGGVVQQAGGARLTLEAFQGFAVSEQVIGKELDSHVATEPRVFGLVHHTHAAAAQLTQNAVVRDRLTDHRLTVGSALAGHQPPHGSCCFLRPLC